MGRSNNTAWEYFDYVDGKVAKCHICDRKVTTPKGSRGNLVRHLLKVHDINARIDPNEIQDQKDYDDKELAVLKRKFEVYLKNQTKGNGEAETQDANDSDDNEVLGNIIKQNKTVNNAENKEKVKQTNIQKSIKAELIKEKNPIEKEVYDSDDPNEPNPYYDPLIEINLESPEKSETLHTSGIEKLPFETRTRSQPNDSLAKLEVEALVERHKAEASYFKALAALTRTKRYLLELQCQKLRKDLSETKTSE